MVPRIKLGLSAMCPKNVEEYFVYLFAFSSLIGVWYALPMLNVVQDTSGFSGGVLRSMETHSLLPNVLIYGTVTFYLCYTTIAAFLLAALPFYHFSFYALKVALLDYPEVIYAVARGTSALTIAFCVIFSYRFLKEELDNAWYRAAIIATVFGNILVAAVSRSGKVWILSSVLQLIAIILAYRSVRNDAARGLLPGKNALASIVVIAAGAANLPIVGVSGVTVLVMAYAFRNISGSWRRLFFYTMIGVVCAAVIVALNFQNTLSLFSQIFTGYHPLFTSDPTVIRPSFFASLLFHSIQMLAVYPLVIALVLVGAFYGVRNKTLLFVSGSAFIIFFVAICFVANWYTNLETYLRYLYPLGFLSLPILASLRAPPKPVLILAVVANTILYLYTIILLSVPSTYNVAAQLIEQKWGTSNVTIDDRVFELDLPMNKKSYTLLDQANCATKCVNALAQNTDISFRPTVVTLFSSYATSSLPRMVIFDTPIATCGTPVIAVPGPEKSEYFDIEHALGIYFEPRFYLFNRLGKHIYVYDAATCSALPQRPLDHSFSVNPS